MIYQHEDGQGQMILRGGRYDGGYTKKKLQILIINNQILRQNLLAMIINRNTEPSPKYASQPKYVQSVRHPTNSLSHQNSEQQLNVRTQKQIEKQSMSIKEMKAKLNNLLEQTQHVMTKQNIKSHAGTHGSELVPSVESKIQKSPPTVQEPKQKIQQERTPTKQAKPLSFNTKKQTKVRTEQNNPEAKQPQNQLSWTKYVSLQLKNQELTNTLQKNDKLYASKFSEMSKELEQKDATIKHMTKKLYEQKKFYEQKIVEMQTQQNEKLGDKNEHIKKLVNELSGLSLKDKENIMSNKLKEIFDENEEIKLSFLQIENQLHEAQNLLVTKEALLNDFKDKQDLYKQEITCLKRQKQALTQKTKFDEMLKVQLSDISQLKEKIEFIQEENNKLKQSLRNLQHEKQKAYNEIRISEIKESSLRNRLITEMTIKLNEKENKIQHLEKRMLTMEEKYKSAIRQIKQKDQFIQQHLMGRTEEVELKNYTEEILQKYMKKFDLTDDHLLHKLEDTIQELTIKLQYYEQNW